MFFIMGVVRYGYLIRIVLYSYCCDHFFGIHLVLCLIICLCPRLYCYHFWLFVYACVLFNVMAFVHCLWAHRWHDICMLFTVTDTLLSWHLFIIIEFDFYTVVGFAHFLTHIHIPIISIYIQYPHSSHPP